MDRGGSRAIVDDRWRYELIGDPGGVGAADGFLSRPGALNAGQAAALSVILMLLTAATVLVADRATTLRRGGL